MVRFGEMRFVREEKTRFHMICHLGGGDGTDGHLALASGKVLIVWVGGIVSSSTLIHEMSIRRSYAHARL